MLGKWNVLWLPPWARPSAFTCTYINYIQVTGMLCCFAVIILAVYFYFPTLWTSFDQWFILITGRTSAFQKEQYHFPTVKNSGWSSLEALCCKGGCNVSPGRAAPGRVNSTPTGPSRTQNAPAEARPTERERLPPSLSSLSQSEENVFPKLFLLCCPGLSPSERSKVVDIKKFSSWNLCLSNQPSRNPTPKPLL